MDNFRRRTTSATGVPMRTVLPRLLRSIVNSTPTTNSMRWRSAQTPWPGSGQRELQRLESWQRSGLCSWLGADSLDAARRRHGCRRPRRVKGHGRPRLRVGFVVRAATVGDAEAIALHAIDRAFQTALRELRTDMYLDSYVRRPQPLDPQDNTN
jgi:hypothetical protein